MKRRKGSLVWILLAAVLLIAGFRGAKKELRSLLSPTPTEAPVTRSAPTPRPSAKPVPEALDPEASGETARSEEISEPEETPEPAAEPEKSVLSPDAIRPDFKAAMDSYEEFFDEYCELIQAIEQDASDLALLAKYGTFMAREAEMTRDFEAWESEDLTDAELKYYMEVNLRVQQKLLSVY